MRIATYNVEWFNALFDDHDRLRVDEGWSGRHDVTRAQQIGALGIVFSALDADAVMVIEAPDQNRRRSTVAALEGFASHFGLRCRKALVGFGNDTQQEIALLYDPDALSAEHMPGGAVGEAPPFDTTWKGEAGGVRFSKPPLELKVRTRAGGCFRMIGVHAKSKAPHGARSASDARRLSIANRRKQLAQCQWLRARVLEHLGRAESLIVLGDLNDGPGLDEYEALFGRSGVEIVLGADQEDPQLRLCDPHAELVLRGPSHAHPTSARFWLAEEGAYLNALIDFVMISPDLRGREPDWRIWHPFDDPQIYAVPELRQALLEASDHFPVSIDIDL